MNKYWVLGGLVNVTLVVCTIQVGSPEQCGRQAGGAVCPGGQCCSKFGWCGTGAAYCSDGCQSQWGGGGRGLIRNLISRESFDQMLKHHNNCGCPGHGFYKC